MKIQCNVCEAAEANVVCCADEAALCWACDEKVHAANKLASKHQRVPLSSSSSHLPKCDICQEMVGYFFCLEDRALLCRKCDLSIHTVNEFVSGHKRFLLTGAKVGLDPLEPGQSSGKSHSGEIISKISATKSRSMSRRGNQTSMVVGNSELVPSNVEGVAAYGQSKVPFSGGSTTESMVPWHLDEFPGLHEFSLDYGHMDHGPSKADSGRFGESDWSSFSRAANDDLDFDECLGQVPETSWTVPQIPSPPTASGLYWPKHSQVPSDVFVPDVGCLPVQNPHSRQSSVPLSKRRRHF